MIEFIKGFVELIKGMGITGKHLGRHAVTIQYPEQKREMFDRSRGIVVLLSDKETGELNCTGCELCMRACPTAAIDIEAPRDPETKKKTLKKFDLDHTLCCFCGLCEEACNFAALKMAGKYEFSTWDKEDLVWDMHKLQEIGRDVPYVDTRKKKPVKKAAPKPAADEKPKAEQPDEKKPVETTPSSGNPTENKPAEPPQADSMPAEKPKPDNNETKSE